MSDGVRHNFADPDAPSGVGEFGNGPDVAPAGVPRSPDTPVFGHNAPQPDASKEQGSDGVSDPSRPAQPAPVTPQSPAPTPPAEPVKADLDENARNYDRDSIISRFKARRETEEAEAAAPRAPEAVTPPAAPQPDPAAPQSQQPAPLALKIRGQNYTATREQARELISYLDPDVDLTGMSDRAIVNAAQLAAIAKIRNEETAAARAQSQQPQQAPDPQQVPQQPPQQPSSQAKSLAELRASAVERTQFGTQDEANQAWEVYERERTRADFAAYDQTRQAQNAEEQIMADVNSWGARNADLVQENSPASRMLLMSAAHEMQDDLRSHGYSDRDLGEALNNPKLMTYLFTQARQQGLRVRSNVEILDAAGHYTRQAFQMGAPAPQAPANQQQQGYAPQPSAMDARLDAKRSLPAQPTRSGNPQSIPMPEVPVERKRSDVIARMAESRTRNNLAEHGLA